MRQIAIDQKLKENPQPAAAIVHMVNPTPISLKGLMLQMQREKKKKTNFYEVHTVLSDIQSWTFTSNNFVSSSFLRDDLEI